MKDLHTIAFICALAIFPLTAFGYFVGDFTAVESITLTVFATTAAIFFFDCMKDTNQ
jgi:riboflavin synthase alpha subunit